MASVVLINPFEITPGREDECLEFWERVAAYMRRQPGFKSTRLHRAAAPGARFHFINMAEWESVDHFQSAVGSEEFKDMVEPYADTFPHYPGLYEVIRT